MSQAADLPASPAPSALPAAIQRYAAEAMKQHAYRTMAGAKVREFEAAWRESMGSARQVMDAGGLRAVAVPEEGVALVRVQREVPGALTLRRVEEYASRMTTAEEMDAIEACARETEAEAREAEAKRVAKAERERAAEERRAQREAARVRREAEREERARQAEMRREEAAARREYERRMKQRQGRLKRVLDTATRAAES